MGWLDDLLDAKRVVLLGVLNATPDSFSDGGRYVDEDRAVAHGLRLVDDGADIVDVGGESTRPGARTVPLDTELARVLPVVRRLAAAGVRVSIDTRHAAVAEQAIEHGAVMVNDIAGLRDPAMRRVAARHRTPAVIVHSPVDDPATMQQHTVYDDLVGSVTAFLAAQARRALDDGVPSVIVDPGIGFGKTTTQNLELLDRVGDLAAVGHPVLVGASRKRFVGELTGTEVPAERDVGSIVAHLHAVERGCRLLRVHDVAGHRQALAMTAALRRGR